MGKLENYGITFSNAQGVFHAGQNVQGNFTVVFGDETSVTSICVKFKGKAKVRWRESHSSQTGPQVFSASECYFDQRVLLWPNQGRDTTTLPAGRHTFPFSFLLPPSTPSSFEGEHGNVRYSVKGIIDRPWKFDDTCQKAFTVIHNLDLNTDSNALMPVRRQQETTICCWCCGTGPITAVFRLERRGYVPGEAIRLFADIQNNSDSVIPGSFVDLKMDTKFHATFKSRTTSTEVGRVTQGPIGEGQSFSWEGQQFVLPPLPPSYLTGCKIIDVRYTLRLTVTIPSDWNLKIPLEIIIGTIPLHQMVEQFPPRAPALPPPQAGYGPPPGTTHPPPEGASAPYPPAEPTAPVMPPSSIPNMPPPSYEKCVAGKGNVPDDDESEDTQL